MIDEKKLIEELKTGKLYSSDFRLDSIEEDCLVDGIINQLTENVVDKLIDLLLNHDLEYICERNSEECEEWCEEHCNELEGITKECILHYLETETAEGSEQE